MWKHHGEDVLPSLKTHWVGLRDLMAWFDRHADPADGLLVTSCYGDWMGFKPESGNGGGSLLTPAASVTAFYHARPAPPPSLLTSYQDYRMLCVVRPSI